jgi:TRAP transporter 4TM/12TM fusion protein
MLAARNEGSPRAMDATAKTDRWRHWLGDIPGLATSGGVPIALIAGALALAMALIHIVQAITFALPSGQFKSLHVNLGTVLIFLLLAAKTGPRRAWSRGLYLLMAAAAAIPLLYIHLEHDSLVYDRVLFPSEADRWIAILMLVTVFTAAWQEWGAIIPGLAVAGLLYGHFGYLIPGEFFFHSGISLDRLIGYTSIPSFGGMLGALTEESARTIFMFMLFAGVLSATGGTSLIMKLSFAAVGHMRAGPAQVAVVSSALFGMISGSTVANVAAQGPYTIPTMRRCGFSPEFAGAIEAVSSTGGQITPPVLGLTAFLIVGLTGTPYFDVMIATVVPAAIFYVYLMINIHIEAIKRGIEGAPDLRLDDGSDLDRLSIGRALAEHVHIIAATVSLFWLLSIDMPTGLAALYPSLMMLAGEAVKQGIRGWRTPARALAAALAISSRGLIEGARSGAQVAVVVAVINVLVEMFVVTGLGQKMSHIMLAISAGNLPLLLGVAAITCLILGCGMPTSAAYILVALLGAPALVKLGVPVLAAHLFVFFYANLSAITPPVALAALVAANISGGSYFRTAFICVWLGLPCFLLPFLFVKRPEIIGLTGTLLDQMALGALALASTACFAFVLQGYMFGPLHVIERMLLLPAVGCLLLPGWAPSIVAYALVVAVSLSQLLGPRRVLAVRSATAAGPGWSLGRLGRELVRRAGQGQTVD